MWMSKLMNTTLALMAFVFVVTVLGLIGSRLSGAWVRKLAVLSVASIALFTVVFTMNDMRAHGSEALRNGKSKEFVAGMAERDQRTVPRRALIFFSVAGLVLLAFARDKNK